MIRYAIARRRAGATLCACISAACAATASAQAIVVRDADGLRAELRRARAGAVIRVAPGEYGNGFWIEGLKGTEKKPIVVEGADGKRPPVFSGGNEALHFSDCNWVTLRNVRVVGCTANGINADDGGSFDTPSRGMVFEKLIVEDIGPRGNHDGLKLSGLDGFVVRDCTFSGWGGSAIDMVGCHDGTIESSRFLGKEGHSQDTGIQAKGGCERIVIRESFFRDAGERAVNLGGSTGLEFFRPKLQDFEARAVEVAGNRFVGSTAPIAFTTSVECVVRLNTIVHPAKWVLRILQEQPLDKFQPCQRGVFENNLVVVDERVRVFVNVGPDTRPETFAFRGNAWFGAGGGRRPELPVAETDGVYQVDPRLEDPDTAEMEVRSTDARLQRVGAHAYRR